MSGQLAQITDFAEATGVRPLGDGWFAAELPRNWAVGRKPHGGYLMALLGRAALAALDVHADPLVVSAQFMRAPALGPALLRTDVRNHGRTATVVGVTLEQDGRSCVEATVTAGRLPEESPAYTDLPDMLAVPPDDAVAMSDTETGGVFRLGTHCDVRVEPGTGFLANDTDAPSPTRLRTRLWARQREAEANAQPDALFALVAGDINIPVTFNLGRYGWAPTVQMTALLRARPTPGWLRIEVECKAVHGDWFDSDATVIDARGRLVCQARQLALSPRS